jgi:hypothetical protein
MATNKKVAESWGHGCSKEASNMSTCGQDLYSYDLLIGYTTEDNKKVLVDHTKSGGGFVSMTTSQKHISPARKFANIVVSPKGYVEHGRNAHLTLEGLLYTMRSWIQGKNGGS